MAIPLKTVECPNLLTFASTTPMISEIDEARRQIVIAWPTSDKVISSVSVPRPCLIRSLCFWQDCPVCTRSASAACARRFHDEWRDSARHPVALLSGLVAQACASTHDHRNENNYDTTITEIFNDLDQQNLQNEWVHWFPEPCVF